MASAVMNNIANLYLVLTVASIAAVIILIIAVVVLISKVGRVVDSVSSGNREYAPASPAVSGVQAFASTSAPAASGGYIRLIGVDEPTAAMVMAVVSNESGIPLEKLRFKSIRCTD